MIKKYVVCMVLSLVITGCGKTNYEYYNGKDGAAGSVGAQGPQGPAGPQGSPGIDATSVSVVKLCQGTTTYPSQFVEIAFCIGNKLYATYSQNGGFSTEIPPGSYGSNGINASCNFTVLPGCGIQN